MYLFSLLIFWILLVSSTFLIRFLLIIMVDLSFQQTIVPNIEFLFSYSPIDVVYDYYQFEC